MAYGVAVACYDLGLGSVLSQQTVLEPGKIRCKTNTSKIRAGTNAGSNTRWGQRPGTNVLRRPGIWPDLDMST